MRMTPAEIVHLAESAGVCVDWTSDVGRADYGAGRIRVNPGLSDAVAVVALAHELGHHERGPSEEAANAYAAGLLIDPGRYADAERLCEGHAGGMARELGVTTAIVEAWRRTYRAA